MSALTTGGAGWGCVRQSPTTFTLHTKLTSRNVLQKPLDCIACLTEPQIKWFGSACIVPDTPCLQYIQKTIGQLQGPRSRHKWRDRRDSGTQGLSILLAPLGVCAMQALRFLCNF